MEENSLLDILQLINTESIGPVSFYKYIKKAGSIRNALDLVAGKKQLCSRSFCEEELERAYKQKAQIIAYSDAEYPHNLRQLNDAPPLLYVLGNAELLQYPVAVAIVGARNASIGGRKTASRIAYDLTNNDVLVVSGMARGIDSAAHKGALYGKEQKGATIAVLGTGVDLVYPAENAQLYKDICQQGAVVSELPLQTAAQVANFPRRNRIISGLSCATLVVEAGLNSGSLITARLAMEQGKDVFAIPGSPLENRAAGPNKLIKDGAILTESAEDILNILSITQNQQIKNVIQPNKALDKAKNNVNILEQENITSLDKQTNLLELIGYDGVDIDELLRVSGMPSAEFFMQITELEFAGKIVRQAGNRLARIK